MTTLTTIDTAEVLAGMFTENTGAHFLDSGGAYGRHHERNAGLTVRDFLNRPAVAIVDEYAPELDAFHFLNDRVTYAPELDAAFSAYYDASEDHALADVGNWLDQIGAEEVLGCNTYNYDAAISQALQFSTFTLGGYDYAIIQVHGGADVRGGYTKPRVFSAVSRYELFEFSQVFLGCLECDFRVYYADGRIEQVESGNKCGPGCGATNNWIPSDQGPDYGRAWTLLDGCPCCAGALM